MNNFDQKHLLERARAGDGQAISELYQRHKDAVFRFVYFRVGSQADAEDLFQDIMIAAFESLDRFRGEVPFLHWCYQIARNKIALFWREHAKHSSVELSDEHPDDEGIDWAGDQIHAPPEEEEAHRARMLQVLEALPGRYAHFLRLRFLEQKTLSQIAEAMDISLNNAKVLQNRALKKAHSLHQSLP